MLFNVIYPQKHCEGQIDSFTCDEMEAYRTEMSIQ